MTQTRWGKLVLAIALLGIILTGYGGLCSKKHNHTVTGGSGDTDTIKIQTTASEFQSALETKNADAIVSKLTGYDEQTAKNFFNDTANASINNDLATALQNATIIKQYENYAVLEANDPQIGKFKIIMIKVNGEWKISGY